MQVLGIRKAEGIEDIVRNQASLDAGEERKKAKVEGSLLFKAFEDVMQTYNKIISYHSKHGHSVQSAGIDSQIYAEQLPALTPELIGLFTQAVAHYDAKNYGFITGHFITAFIRRSYNAGYNDFQLNTKSMVKPMDYFGYELSGSWKNPIIITVNGNLGDNCCFASSNLRLTANKIGKDLRGRKNVIVKAESTENICGRKMPGFRFFYKKLFNKPESMADMMKVFMAKSMFSTAYLIGKGLERELWIRF